MTLPAGAIGRSWGRAIEGPAPRGVSTLRLSWNGEASSRWHSVRRHFGGWQRSRRRRWECLTCRWFSSPTRSAESPSSWHSRKRITWWTRWQRAFVNAWRPVQMGRSEPVAPPAESGPHRFTLFRPSPPGHRNPRRGRTAFARCLRHNCEGGVSDDYHGTRAAIDRD